MRGDRSPGAILSLSSRVLWGGSVEDAAAMARELGYDGLEIWAEHAWREKSPGVLARSLRHIPLHYSMHGPSMDINCCSLNPRVAALSIAECERAMVWARRLGIRVVVIHPGHMASSKGDPEEYWPRLLAALGRLARRAGSLGLALAVENMEPRPREFVTTSQDALRAFGSVTDANLYLCLDLAHAAMVSESAADDLVRDNKDRICHVHISNVAPGRPHLPMDQGHVPVSPYVRRFLTDGFLGVITLEGALPPGPRTAEVGLVRLRELLLDETGR